MTQHNGDWRRTAAAMLARAEAALSRHEGTKAARIANGILRRDRSHIAALEMLARSLWQQNRFEDLVPVTQRLIRNDPYEPGYRLLLGAAYQCLGRFGEATRAYASIPPDAPEHSRSMELVSELRDWQSGLVSRLLVEDPVFRAEYARDPNAACQTRGFELLPAQRIERDAYETHSASSTRPS